MAGNDIGVIAAFAGGIASFASPCVLPLVPAYLSIVGGLDVARPIAEESEPGEDDLSTRPEASTNRRTMGAMTVNTVLFVAGFTAVFVILGLSTSALGRAVIHQQATLTRISGVVVVAMALFLGGTLLFKNPGYYREWRIHPRLAALGHFAAPIAGAAFAFGWTPCVGPVLASVLALSATQGHVADSALLLSSYSLGLGVPFLAMAVFFDRLRGPLAWLRRHGKVVTALSAITLGVLGILLVLDRLAWVTTQFQRL